MKKTALTSLACCMLGACASDGSHTPSADAAPVEAHAAPDAAALSGTGTSAAPTGGGSAVATADAGDTGTLDANSGAGTRTTPLDASPQGPRESADQEDAEAPEETDDDGGAPMEPEPCLHRACLCELLCKRITQRSCLGDPPSVTCAMRCAPEPASCAAESVALLRCQSEQTVANFTCDPDFDVAIIHGCAEAEQTLTACQIDQ